jgi:hypothetical protein
MTLEFKTLSSNPIRTIVFFVMKSYGPKWSNSRVQITATSQGEEETTLLSQVLEGFHDRPTSETYAEAFQLKQAISSETPLRLQMQLIDGQTFKLMGLAICS